MNGWPINLFDTAVILIVLLSGGLAFLRGFTRETLSLLAWVGAALAAWLLFPYARPIGQNLISAKWLADGATGLALYIPSLIILSIVSHHVSQMVKSSTISALDRTLGFIFGLGRGAVMVAILYLGMGWLIPMQPPPEWVNGARTLPLIQYGADLFLSLNPDGQKILPAAPPAPAAAPPEPSKQPPDNAAETGYKTLQRRALEQLIDEGNASR